MQVSYERCQFTCNPLRVVKLLGVGFKGDGRLRLAMPSATGYVVCDRLLTSATEPLQKENEQILYDRLVALHR